ncbi:MAG: sulfite exporter TauE/SafE family protein [bacterium]
MKIKEHVYFVKGMHCASCEILIEKKLLELQGIESVEASVKNGQVLIEYENEKPSKDKLNKLFQQEGYAFLDKPFIGIEDGPKENDWIIIIGSALFIIIGFILLNKSGIAGAINVNSKSSLPMFFVLGLLAGISSCAALVGGLVLSMSKQWDGKPQPHIMFNLGRIVFYAVFGFILGAIGSKIQISFTFTTVLIIVVSIIMVFLGLQMLGVKKLRRFQITMPKFITRYVADESNFKGKYMPFIMGALTFFLPCGFTITAQGLALLSGSPVQGGLIMLFFALGTMPTLFAIGLSSIKFSSRTHWSSRFSKIAGILVLFFALFNFNSQLNVIGIPSFNNINLKGIFSTTKNSSGSQIKDLAPIINGKQILKMDASSRGYSPNYFKVKVGIPVRWEIIDKGTSGCTNAVISKSLFEGEISLTPGQTSIKEFTPEKPGKYKFSCWMGMISGIIEVIDGNDATSQNNSLDNNGNLFSPSGVESSGGSCGINGICGCGER